MDNTAWLLVGLVLGFLITIISGYTWEYLSVM